MVKILNADFSTEAEKILERATIAMDKLRQENLQAMIESEQVKQQGENERNKENNKTKLDIKDKDVEIALMKERGSTLRNNTNADTQKKIKAAEIEEKYVNSTKNNSSSQKK